MPFIDISDEVFVVAAPEAIADHVKDTRRQSAWFPGITLTVLEDRKANGVRWAANGAVSGSAEIWVEPCMDGAVIHTFLRGETSNAKPWALTVKNAAFSIKDALEAGRKVGQPRA